MSEDDMLRPDRRVVMAALCAATIPAVASPSLAATSSGLPDPFYQQPYIDKDEWRDQPRRHRYVHGGFQGTDLRFSAYFPPKEDYGGRFFQFLEGGYGGNENAAVGGLAMITISGGLNTPFDMRGYLVESNQGHLGDMKGIESDGRLLNYRASAAVARYVKILATEMYGAPPKYGYVYGGSGGGVRTLKCIENVSDVWDGAVPYMMAVHSMEYAYKINALRMCWREWDRIVDAVEPGGSGDPFAGLSAPQREALAELYASGFARGAEFLMPALWPNANFAIEEIAASDPEYFTDFWTKRGYLGADNPAAVGTQFNKQVRVKAVRTLEEVFSDSPPDPFHMRGLLGRRGVGRDPGARQVVVLEGLDPDECYVGARLIFETGAAKGRQMLALGNVGASLIVTGPLLRRTDWGADPFRGVQPGDTLTVHNRDFIAFCYYNRHAYQAGGHYARTPVARRVTIDGAPVHPQRTQVVDGPRNLQPDYTGRFAGKVILQQHALDSMLGPANAESYRQLVRQAYGDKESERFRLWWVEHAHHVPAKFVGRSEGPGSPALTRLIDYQGGLEDALRYLVDWVEKGQAPPPTTGYVWTAQNALQLAPSAKVRRAAQPVVAAQVNGAIRADVKAGQPVTFTMRAEMPPGAKAKIVRVDWDFDGGGAFATPQMAMSPGASAAGSVTHVFDRPGVYFPAVKVRAHRSGDPEMADRGPSNLARVRVVVT